MLAASASEPRAQRGAIAGEPAVTFTRDVAPILYANCATCHRPNGPAPFSLLSFDEARRRATQIAKVTADRVMPPWKPEPGLEPFVGERRLSDKDIASLKVWAETGATEGDPALLPRTPVFASNWQLGQPDLVIAIPGTRCAQTASTSFATSSSGSPSAGCATCAASSFAPGPRPFTTRTSGSIRRRHRAASRKPIPNPDTKD